MLLTMRALLLILLLALPLAAVRGQELSLHHGFPLAGDRVRIVVEGFEPGGLVRLELQGVGAIAPSFVRALQQIDARFIESGAFAQTSADAAGVFDLEVALGAEDIGARIELVVTDPFRGGAVPISLLVHPPTALMSVEGGLARVDLLRGQLLGPVLRGAEALRGAGLQADGLTAWALRDAGRLELFSVLRWGEAPLTVRSLPAGGESLAHSPRAGAVFVLSALGDSLLGRLEFVDTRFDALSLEALDAAPAHRRWAVSEDGRRGFVAEAALLVREVDLAAGTHGGVFTAGVAGDTSIVDMLVLDSRLLVLTRREGSLGSLTSYDLRTGWVATHTLDVDPARLIAMDDQRALVVPQAGALLTVIQDGVPGRPVFLGEERELLDVAPVSEGALLLLSDQAGQRSLWRFDAATRRLGSAPEASFDEPYLRVLGGGGDVALLLGAASGEVSRFDLASGRLTRVAGLSRRAGAPFVLLP